MVKNLKHYVSMDGALSILIEVSLKILGFIISDETKYKIPTSKQVSLQVNVQSILEMSWQSKEKWVITKTYQ